MWPGTRPGARHCDRPHLTPPPSGKDGVLLNNKRVEGDTPTHGRLAGPPCSQALRVGGWVNVQLVFPNAKQNSPEIKEDQIWHNLC